MTPRGWLGEMLGYRHLLANCVRRELTLKYHRSTLGVLWSFLKPLALTALYVFAARNVIGMRDDRLIPRIAVGIAAWVFFSTVIVDSLRLLQQHRTLLRQVAFPRELLVLGRVGVLFVELLVALGGMKLLLACTGHGGFAVDIAHLVPALASAALLGSACALLVAPLGALFEDAVHLAEVSLSVLFWLTPVVYTAARVPPQYAALLAANPLAPVIGLLRSAFIAGEPPPALAATTIVVAVAAAAALAVPIFRRATADIAEAV